MSTANNSKSLSILVLGGSGLIGSHIVGLLQPDYNVISLQRTKQSEHQKVDYRTLDIHDRTALTELLNEIPGNKLIIDAVLDKQSAKTLSSGLVAGSQAIADVLRDRSDITSLVIVSTTAILAPKLLRTGYANAKRRQCALYAQALQNTRFFLCPQVVESGSQKQANKPNPNDKIVINVQQAAYCIKAIVDTDQKTQSNTSHLLYLPGTKHYRVVPANTRLSQTKSALNLLGGCTSWVVQPNSRHYSERTITHSLLNLLPPVWRTRYDHHLLPVKRINKTADDYGLKVIRLED